LRTFGVTIVAHFVYGLAQSAQWHAVACVARIPSTDLAQRTLRRHPVLLAAIRRDFSAGTVITKGVFPFDWPALDLVMDAVIPIHVEAVPTTEAPSRAHGALVLALSLA
jgi:hypothetical protein